MSEYLSALMGLIYHHLDNPAITGQEKQPDAETAKREKLFSDFIAEATRL
ncbi:hypothetical protein [Rhizobium mesoamericanum]|uniref:Uncharacterized protein n=1 Tax=Rhizobium mesoamericanum STM3625 TaxID=1211777 RepID=K0PFQ1_9HYPH|nr:hypothetical protein [Rhizobium mesoamericanum]CCM75331.1 hypothetical protein BN77_2473 [Rhizobium mesoamericanum STM3625]